MKNLIARIIACLLTTSLVAEPLLAQTPEATFSREAMSMPASAFLHRGMNGAASVAMLRSIENEWTPSTRKLNRVLRNVSSAHEKKMPGLVEEFKKQIISILRTDVPKEERGLALGIAQLVWSALPGIPAVLALPEFQNRILKVIEGELNGLTERFIELHDVVLDVDRVYRILEGREGFDPEKDADKIWRKRDPSRDDRHLREAVTLITHAVIRGIHQELQSVLPSEREAHRTDILDRAVDRGALAHGMHDVGAFRSGGVLAMIRRAECGPYVAVSPGEFVVTDAYRSSPTAVTGMAAAEIVVTIYEKVNRVGVLAHFENDVATVDESVKRLFAALDDAEGTGYDNLKVSLVRNPHWPATKDPVEERDTLELMAMMADAEGETEMAQEYRQKAKELGGPNAVFNKIEETLRTELNHRRVHFEMRTYFRTEMVTIALQTGADGEVLQIPFDETQAHTDIHKALVAAVVDQALRVARRSVDRIYFPLIQRPTPAEKGLTELPSPPRRSAHQNPSASSA